MQSCYHVSFKKMHLGRVYGLSARGNICPLPLANRSHARGFAAGNRLAYLAYPRAGVDDYNYLGEILILLQLLCAGCSALITVQSCWRGGLYARSSSF